MATQTKTTQFRCYRASTDETRFFETRAEALRFCEGVLKPLLDALPKDRDHYLGEDFGRFAKKLNPNWSLGLGKVHQIQRALALVFDSMG